MGRGERWKHVRGRELERGENGVGEGGGREGDGERWVSI